MAKVVDFTGFWRVLDVEVIAARLHVLDRHLPRLRRLLGPCGSLRLPANAAL